MKIQEQPEKELHCLETNPLGSVLPLYQPLTNPTEESNWTNRSVSRIFFSSERRGAARRP